VIDSWLRCPRDGKLLVLDGSAGIGAVQHICLHCGYAEVGPASPVAKSSGRGLMERIRDKVRDG